MRARRVARGRDGGVLDVPARREVDLDEQVERACCPPLASAPIDQQTTPFESLPPPVCGDRDAAGSVSQTFTSCAVARADVGDPQRVVDRSCRPARSRACRSSSASAAACRDVLPEEPPLASAAVEAALPDAGVPVEVALTRREHRADGAAVGARVGAVRARRAGRVLGRDRVAGRDRRDVEADVVGARRAGGRRGTGRWRRSRCGRSWRRWSRAARRRRRRRRPRRRPGCRCGRCPARPGRRSRRASRSRSRRSG